MSQATATPAITAAPVEQKFQPIVTVTVQPDGRHLVELDWSDSYIHTYDPATGENVWDGESSGAVAAGRALDRVVKMLPVSITI